MDRARAVLTPAGFSPSGAAVVVVQTLYEAAHRDMLLPNLVLLAQLAHLLDACVVANFATPGLCYSSIRVLQIPWAEPCKARPLSQP